MHFAFWDPAARRLVDPQSDLMDSELVTMNALYLSMLWQLGGASLPSPYWLAWDDDPGGESLRVFTLADAPPLDEAEMDALRAEVRGVFVP